MSFGALLSSEIRRLFARRAVRWGTLALLALVLLVIGVAAVRSTGTGPSDHTMRLRQLWDQAGGGTPRSLVLQMSVYVFLVVVGVAASAVGGEYRAGTMGTLLTWEPRRGRVALARMLAVVVVAVVVFAIVTGMLVGGWSLGATWRGSTAGLGEGFWRGVAEAAIRGAVGAAILGLLTAGVAFVTRSTVGAILSWLGYLIGIELVFGFRNRAVQPGLLMANLGAFLQGHRVETSARFTGDGIERYLALPGPGLIRITVIALVVAGLGGWVFRRRDVA